MNERRTPLSQRFKISTVEGLTFTQFLFDDLDDKGLQLQFDHYVETEDFDYCAELVAEATSRSIFLMNPRMKKPGVAIEITSVAKPDLEAEYMFRIVPELVHPPVLESLVRRGVHPYILEDGMRCYLLDSLEGCLWGTVVPEGSVGTGDYCYNPLKQDRNE